MIRIVRTSNTMSLTSKLLQAVLVCGSSAFAAEELGDLTEKFELRRAEIYRVEVEDPLATLSENYKTAVANLQKSSAEKGKLDLALAAKEELEQFAEGKHRDATDIADLKRLQDIYEKQLADLKAAYSKQEKPLFESYAKKLEQLVLEFTKANRLEDAVATRKEVERVKTLIGEFPSRAPKLQRTDSSAGKGRLHAFGKFWGARDVGVDTAGSSSNFVAVQARDSRGWVALQSTGSVVTDTDKKVRGFKRRVTKLCSSDMYAVLLGIDSDGNLEVVSVGGAIPKPLKWQTSSMPVRVRPITKTRF